MKCVANKVWRYFGITPEVIQGKNLCLLTALSNLRHDALRWKKTHMQVIASPNPQLSGYINRLFGKMLFLQLSIPK